MILFIYQQTNSMSILMLGASQSIESGTAWYKAHAVYLLFSLCSFSCSREITNKLNHNMILKTHTI